MTTAQSVTTEPTALPLARFGHHPDPVIDFCVEVEALEAEHIDRQAGMAPTMDIAERIFKAMTFKASVNQMALAAKSSLRRLDVLYPAASSSASTAPAVTPNQPNEKAERVRALVNAGTYPGMSEAFDAHMGAPCWTDPAYAPDASTWASAWRAALQHQAGRHGRTDQRIGFLRSTLRAISQTLDDGELRARAKWALEHDEELRDGSPTATGTEPAKTE